jgi:hypothetical protein
MSYLERLIATEKNLKRPPPPSVESIETPQGGALDTLDTTPPGPFQKISSTEQSPACRLWLITHADGRLVSHSFTPPATEDELRAWYPQALKIEPEPEPEPV